MTAHLKTAAIALLAVAVVQRVPALRKIVFGN